MRGEKQGKQIERDGAAAKTWISLRAAGADTASGFDLGAGSKGPGEGVDPFSDGLLDFGLAGGAGEGATEGGDSVLGKTNVGCMVVGKMEVRTIGLLAAKSGVGEADHGENALVMVSGSEVSGLGRDGSTGIRELAAGLGMGSRGNGLAAGEGFDSFLGLGERGAGTTQSSGGSVGRGHGRRKLEAETREERRQGKGKTQLKMALVCESK